MSVTVRAKLPKGDTNGLAALEGALADSPDDPLYIVGVVRTDTIEARPHDDENPRMVKTILLHVEAVLAQTDIGKVEKLMRDVYQSRTGKVELPFEDGDEP
jgi:hypothetical protein